MLRIATFWSDEDMSEPAPDKINGAVHACLDACYGSATPLKAIAEFISRLDGQPTWTADEIDQVETCVLKMLVKIAGRPAESQHSLSEDPSATS